MPLSSASNFTPRLASWRLDIRGQQFGVEACACCLTSKLQRIAPFAVDRAGAAVDRRHRAHVLRAARAVAGEGRQTRRLRLHRPRPPGFYRYGLINTTCSRWESSARSSSCRSSFRRGCLRRDQSRHVDAARGHHGIRRRRHRRAAEPAVRTPSTSSPPDSRSRRSAFGCTLVAFSQSTTFWSLLPALMLHGVGSDSPRAS